MRRKYQIRIDERNRAEVDYALRIIGCKPDISSHAGDHNEHQTHDYLVDLSKYELLFVRLACSTGKIRKL